MSNQVIQKRGRLERFAEAIRSGRITLGFIGGSITEAHRPSNWPYFITSWLLQRYPGLRIRWENAAIGGTGSLSGGFRCEEDLLNENCDIVFFEYAVNDGPGPETFRTREGLLRMLLAAGLDVVMVHTYCQDHDKAMAADKMPQGIVELEQLAEHYNVSSVWVGLHAYNEVKAGRMTWEAWLPEGLHPEYMGSSVYAEAVIRFLSDELSAPAARPILRGAAMPEPIDPGCFQKYVEVPFDDVEFLGPWHIQREVKQSFFRHSLVTASDGASIRFKFKGRALTMMQSFGKTSGVFQCSIDGGEPVEIVGERDWWVPDAEWARPFLLADGLKPGEHTCTFTVRHGNRAECKGTNCRILSIKSVL